jgi:NAD-dependent protein deacetylase/lipoamidase sirtuin 4
VTEKLAALLRGRRLAVLTGAGVSTDSGIPDYRGPETRGKPRTPIQHADFVRHAGTRRRYWARSMVGWPRFRELLPNATHRALRRLEAAGVAVGLITQNVDRLHHKAGQERVVELHGALADVVCLDCGAREPRDALQARLVAANADFPIARVKLAPDGDAELPPEAAERFVVPSCTACGGTLKPDVVFFGGSVPRPRVETAFAFLEGAEALLVVGTSLAVYSGFRFVRAAAERGLPVAIVNLGETRGDALARLRVDAPAASVLPGLTEQLVAG